MKLITGVFFALAMATTFNAEAGSKSASVSVDMTENYQAYSLVENKNTEIVLDLTDRKAVTNSSVDGQSQTQTITQLPRKEKGEVDTLTVKKISDTKVLIINDTVAFVDTQAGEMKFALRTELEADLTRGTWADLQNNLDVELKVTKKAKATYEKVTVDYLTKVMAEETAAAISQQVGQKVSVSLNLKMKSSDVVYSGTLQRLTSNSTAKLSGRMTIRW